MAPRLLNALAAATFAGGAAVTLQWSLEKFGHDRDEFYEELAGGSRLVVLLALLFTALLDNPARGRRRKADLVALAAAAAHRILTGVVTIPHRAVLAAAGIIIAEAFTFALLT